MKKLILIALLLVCSVAYGQHPVYWPLKIEEVDESPTGRPSTLKVTNGSLTDNGDNTFTLLTGAGGGGATQAGGGAGTRIGGAGATTSITGSAVGYAGGGNAGGCAPLRNPTPVGFGAGGYGSAGTANTGGGGGASNNAGGSGIVIIRYKFQN